MQNQNNQNNQNLNETGRGCCATSGLHLPLRHQFVKLILYFSLHFAYHCNSLWFKVIFKMFKRCSFFHTCLQKQQTPILSVTLLAMNTVQIEHGTFMTTSVSQTAEDGKQLPFSLYPLGKQGCFTVQWQPAHPHLLTIFTRANSWLYSVLLLSGFWLMPEQIFSRGGVQHWQRILMLNSNVSGIWGNVCKEKTNQVSYTV